MATMDALLATVAEEIKKLAGSADEQVRRKTIDTLRDLQYALEPPEETMQRLLYTNLTAASIRVSLDLGIFNILSESDKPLSLSELAAKTKADPVLLGRFLRHQASLGYIKETNKNEFAASHTTRNLSVPDIQSGLIFCNDVLGPSFQAIPEFVKEKKYQNPEQLLDTPFHKAWKTDLPLWTWLHQHPEQTTHFNRFMYAQRSSLKNCFTFLPIDDETKDWPSEKAVFVDIGGGTGQQCVAIKDKFPKLPGKVILQDLPAVIAEAKLPAGIEAQAHDFFTPQPVKGAKYYYLRAIMHDHADDKCLEILKNVVNAMTDESTLLLDEIVVPNEKVEWYVTQTDLAMMVQFSSTERTEDQWRELLAKAGLTVKKITTYTYSFKLSIIAATKTH